MSNILFSGPLGKVRSVVLNALRHTGVSISFFDETAEEENLSRWTPVSHPGTVVVIDQTGASGGLIDLVDSLNPNGVRFVVVFPHLGGRKPDWSRDRFVASHSLRPVSYRERLNIDERQDRDALIGLLLQPQRHGSSLERVYINPPVATVTLPVEVSTRGYEDEARIEITLAEDITPDEVGQILKDLNLVHRVLSGNDLADPVIQVGHTVHSELDHRISG